MSATRSDYDHDYTNFGIPVRDASGSYSPYSLRLHTNRATDIAVGLTYTISPTMVNEFTFGKIWNGIGWY